MLLLVRHTTSPRPPAAHPAPATAPFRLPREKIRQRVSWHLPPLFLQRSPVRILGFLKASMLALILAIAAVSIRRADSWLPKVQL